MGFGDWLGSLGSGIGDIFSGGGGGGYTPGVASGGYGGDVGTGMSGVQADVPYSGSVPGAGGGGGGGNWFTNMLPMGAPSGGAGGGSGGAGGGGGSWWSGLGNLAKEALPYVQLGSTGLGMIGGIKSMQQGSQQMDVLKRQQANQERMAAPAAAAGAQLTTAGSEALIGGKLPPQQETQVQAYADQLRQQYRSYLANIGMSDSSAAVEMEGFINQQVAAYRQQLAQSLYGAGMQGIGTALGPSSAASGTAAGVVSGTEQKLAGANASLSKMLGSQS